MKRKRVGGLVAAVAGAAAAFPIPASALHGADSTAECSILAGGEPGVGAAPSVCHEEWHQITGAAPHRRWRHHRIWRPAYAEPAWGWGYPYWYDPLTYRPWCWQQIWHLYGWQWINICYGY